MIKKIKKYIELYNKWEEKLITISIYNYYLTINNYTIEVIILICILLII